MNRYERWLALAGVLATSIGGVLCWALDNRWWLVPAALLLIASSTWRATAYWRAGSREGAVPPILGIIAILLGGIAAWSQPRLAFVPFAVISAAVLMLAHQHRRDERRFREETNASLARLRASMQALGPEPDGMIPVKVIRHSQHGVDCSPGCACRDEEADD
jgi:hypothetical protein